MRFYYFGSLWMILPRLEATGMILLKKNMLLWIVKDINGII